MIQTLKAHLLRLWFVAIGLALVSGVCSACNRVEPPEPVEVEVVSSSTKEDWISTVTESFNDEQFQTVSGKPIVVRVEHDNSGDSKDAIIDGESQPTLWSPGDMSWVERANQEWQEETGQPLISSNCPPTVYVPTGFAMWRPMAAALGWPEAPIHWSDILDLASDPNGWARYNHPEWGQFKLGLTVPKTSNSGVLIMTALTYAMLGETQELTPEQVRSQQVVEAFEQLGLHTAEFREQSSKLLESMVTGGPSQLHAINTNEAETLKSNARYGNLLPFPFVFVFPADGTVWAEHPFCLLDTDWVSDEQREAARLYTAYLLELEQQMLAAEKGLRPANPTVELGPPFTLPNGTDPDVTSLTVPALDGPSAAVHAVIQELFPQTEK